MSLLWTRQTLEQATGGIAGGPIAATGVSIDTRSLQPGDLFIALRGEHDDGHAHVEQALRLGAAAAVLHDASALPAGLARDPRLLHVRDTQSALTDLGRFARARFQGRMVAVTGSVGKTTTKEMLRTALSALGATHAASASHNNHWGVPLTLARLDPSMAFCVCEIGMNHPGEIAPLAALVSPDIAVITTIGASHIGHMGSLDAIAAEKAALLAVLQPGGVAVIPADATGLDAAAGRAREAGIRLLRFGETGDASLRNLQLHANETAFVADFAGKFLPVTLLAPGRHMAMNALACLAVVHAIDADLAASAAALAGFTPGDGRGALRRLAGGAALLDESYNASSASVRAALELLALVPAERHVAVLGDMLELGDFAVSEHLSLLPFVRDSADIVYCCGEMMTKLYKALPQDLQGACEADAATLAPVVARAMRPGDVILVKGSYGSRMREIVAALAPMPSARPMPSASVVSGDAAR
ncbi:UDP-N-acetylmuramoyl-tripeptide--D-alanyl-D-alanine ligase [Lichenicoccus sp.]|uniref:UDP-N-acetylmuramoyl-tripeptide--D-alanyl-D- alanine ligase n=1 Tax=Lichenicoccus sp. TaxID=2781899 RepID=UPI003D13D3D9